MPHFVRPFFCPWFPQRLVLTFVQRSHALTMYGVLDGGCLFGVVALRVAVSFAQRKHVVRYVPTTNHIRSRMTSDTYVVLYVSAAVHRVSFLYAYSAAAAAAAATCASDRCDRPQFTRSGNQRPPPPARAPSARCSLTAVVSTVGSSELFLSPTSHTLLLTLTALEP